MLGFLGLTPPLSSSIQIDTKIWFKPVKEVTLKKTGGSGHDRGMLTMVPTSMSNLCLTYSTTPPNLLAESSKSNPRDRRTTIIISEGVREDSDTYKVWNLVWGKTLSSILQLMSPCCQCQLLSAERSLKPRIQTWVERKVKQRCYKS